LEFAPRDRVFMRAIPTKGIGRAIRSRNLSPNFVRPYPKICSVAYEIVLSSQLENQHVVSCVSIEEVYN